MIKQLVSLAAILLLIAACSNKETTPDGIEYTVHTSNEEGRLVEKGDILTIHMVAKVERNDSQLFDTYSNGKPFEIPAEEPTLGSVLSLLKKGDSASFSISADTLFNKSFRQSLPPGVIPGDKIVFHVSMVDIYNQEEIKKKIETRNSEYKAQDSLVFSQLLAATPEYKTTPSGLRYIIVKSTNGKKVMAGNKVTVKYKGSFLDGKIFDQTKEGQPDFVFNVGARMVIPGWDEGLQLMKEGETCRLLIPWNLGYGEFGSGPIPPFSSLLFDIELVKVEPK